MPVSMTIPTTRSGTTTSTTKEKTPLRPLPRPIGNDKPGNKENEKNKNKTGSTSKPARSENASRGQTKAVPVLPNPAAAAGSGGRSRKNWNGTSIARLRIRARGAKPFLPETTNKKKKKRTAWKAIGATGPLRLAGVVGTKNETTRTTPTDPQRMPWQQSISRRRNLLPPLMAAKECHRRNDAWPNPRILPPEVPGCSAIPR
mmetsp:Transcript_25534/g.54501  ORF Transcript_25534/g.54501 Transcript_25534/m.54501 type:complete len:202 (-) Transcript_25534:663-1268(-)